MRLPEKRRPWVAHAFDGPYLDRLRSGDGETVRHFVAYFSELIRIKLRVRSWSRGLVEDVRQETFLRVFRALAHPGGIRDPERLGAFVNSVCGNVAMEVLRAQRRHGVPAQEPPDARDRTPDPEVSLLSRERQELVRRVVDDLPRRDRSVLRAVFLDEREKDEVCAQLGVCRDYLRVLLHRAKAAFRAQLREHGPAAAPAAAHERWLP
jgi:RNA polymerase sigma-70 factor (ECF subfamily)